jgi:transposase
MQTAIGVDVAKDEVVIAYAQGGAQPFALRNQRPALQAWLKGVPKGSHIGVKATGSYHELIADLAFKAGMRVFVLNSKDTRHYAKAVGQRAKTDRVDAALIARLIEREHDKLNPYVAPSKEQRALERLLKRPQTLTLVKGIMRQSLTGLDLLASELTALLKRMDRLIALMDARIVTLIAQNPQRAESDQRLKTIVGVGPVVSAGLTSALTRIPFKSADAFVAFTGLDPRPDDSGKRHGRRRLSKRGPALLRRLLFTAAMSTIRTKTWQPLYAHYRAKEWATTAVLVIIARKIARTAWSIYHHHTVFNPERLTKCLT